MKNIITILLPACALLVSVSNAQETSPPVLAPATPPVDAGNPPLSSEASFFYGQLAPYGQWFWTAPHGWVWAPNVSVGWRPYTDGSWSYTDAGWTWVSDAEWGWAPFHYGRWFFHEHRGWCWVPGSEWAPAWVSWHWGDAWCGWAPLPPGIAWESGPNWDVVIPPFGWCFVAPANFCRPHLREHIAIVAQNVTLLKLTRNVTRFDLRDHRVVNVSVSAEQVERVTGRPVARLHIADIAGPSSSYSSVVVKNEVRIYRPEVRATKVVAPSHTVVATPSPRDLTLDQVRREEAGRRELEAAHAQEQQALEQAHQRELRQPPPGLTPNELRDRHLAEHRAFNEHVIRQNQVYENRGYTPQPPIQNRGTPAFSQHHSGRAYPN